MAHGNPPQMFDHGLDPIKGWFHLSALDKSASAADIDDARLVAGRVVHLDASGEFEPGLSGDSPGIFLWQSATSFDVARDSGGIGGQVLSGLVSLGAYELESTEFVDAVYAPNDPLTSTSADDTNLGKITAGIYGTNTIVGIATAAKRTNENSVDVLRFWTHFFPASG